MYFVRVSDRGLLQAGGQLKIRANDGITKPDFQHDIGILIEEIRETGNGSLYVCERF
jgi:hypothetical protein